MSGGRPKGGGRRTHLTQRKVSSHRGPAIEHDAETGVETGNSVPGKRATRSAVAGKAKQAAPVEAIPVDVPTPAVRHHGGELVDPPPALVQLVEPEARDGVRRPKRTAAVASGNKISQIAEMENPARKKRRCPSTGRAEAAKQEDRAQAHTVNAIVSGSQDLPQDVSEDENMPAVIDAADTMLDFSLALAQSSFAPGAGSDTDSSYGEDYDYLLPHEDGAGDSFENAVVEAEDMIRALNDRRVLESPQHAAGPQQRNGGRGRRKGKKTPASASMPIAPAAIAKPATFVLAIPVFSASKKEYKNKSFIKAANPTYATARTTILAACDCEPNDAAALRFKVVMNKPTEPLDNEDDYQKLLAAVDKEEAKKKYTEMVTVYIVSEELAKRAKEKKKGRSGANKDIPPELLTGDAVQCEWMSKLYPRFYGKCAKCGAKELCKIDASGNHGLTIPELFDWVVCLVKRVPGVSLEDPPKKRMFARFWGPSVPLQDDDGLDRRGQAPPPPPASRTNKASAASAPFDPHALGLALAAAHQYSLQDSALRTANQSKEVGAGDISIIGDAHRFLSIHDFLAELTAAEAARPDGRSRDWTVHGPRFDTQKVLHVGELEDWTVSDYIDAIGMVMGEAKTFQKLVQSNISKVIASKKDELRIARTAAAAVGPDA